MTIGLDDPADPSRLDQSADYGRLADLIRRQFETPRQLLEELVYAIETDIRDTFPQTRSCNLSIRKLHPPTGIPVSYSEVSLVKDYRET